MYFLARAAKLRTDFRAGDCLRRATKATAYRYRFPTSESARQYASVSLRSSTSLLDRGDIKLIRTVTLFFE
jgi:hypothetical protein